MNTFKRLIYSFKGSLAQVADDFENHQAVAEAAIQELEQLYARTRVQHQRVMRQCEVLHDRIEETEAQARSWSERAARCGQEDEAGALECLRRRRDLRRKIEHLRVQERETLQLKDKIAQDLARLSAKLDELKRRKELLASRQSRTDAEILVQGFGWDSAGSLEAVLDRWESRIESERPLSSDLAFPEKDDFAVRFEKAELDADLRAELAELVGKGRESSADEKGED